MQHGEVLPRHALGLSSQPVGPKKRQNAKENKGLVRFGWAHLGGPVGTQKRSHAAWRSFLFPPERSHAAWRSFCIF